MYAKTVSGATTQSLRRGIGEDRAAVWCKSEEKFRKHRVTTIYSEMVKHRGLEVVIDRERKGSRVEYRLDVLYHKASFEGRSREEVVEKLNEWIDVFHEQSRGSEILCG